MRGKTTWIAAVATLTACGSGVVSRAPSSTSQVKAAEEVLCAGDGDSCSVDADCCDGSCPDGTCDSSSGGGGSTGCQTDSDCTPFCSGPGTCVTQGQYAGSCNCASQKTPGACCDLSCPDGSTRFCQPGTPGDCSQCANYDCTCPVAQSQTYYEIQCTYDASGFTTTFNACQTSCPSCPDGWSQVGSCYVGGSCSTGG